MKSIEYSLSNEFTSLINSLNVPSSSSSSSTSLLAYTPSCWLLHPSSSDSSSSESSASSLVHKYSHHHYEFTSTVLEEITLLLQRSGIVCGLIETTTVPPLTDLYPSSSSSSSIRHEPLPSTLSDIQYRKYLIIFSTNSSTTVLPILTSMLTKVFDSRAVHSLDTVPYSILPASSGENSRGFAHYLHRKHGSNLNPTVTVPSSSVSYSFTHVPLPNDTSMDELLSTCLRNYLHASLFSQNWIMIGNNYNGTEKNSSLFLYGIRTDMNTTNTNRDPSLAYLSSSLPLSEYHTKDGTSIHDAAHVTIGIEKYSNPSGHRPLTKMMIDGRTNETDDDSGSDTSSLSSDSDGDNDQPKLTTVISTTTTTSPSTFASTWKIILRIEPFVVRLRHLTPELLTVRDKFLLPSPSSPASIPIAPLPLQTKGDTDNLQVYTLPSLIPATIESVIYANTNTNLSVNRSTHGNTTISSHPKGRNLEDPQKNLPPAPTEQTSAFPSFIQGIHYQLLGYQVHSLASPSTPVAMANVVTSSKAMHAIIRSRTTAPTMTSEETFRDTVGTYGFDDEFMDTATEYATSLSTVPRTAVPLSLCLIDMIPLRWLSRLRATTITTNIENVFGSVKRMDNTTSTTTYPPNRYVSCGIDLTKGGIGSILDHFYDGKPLPNTVNGTGMIPLLVRNNNNDDPNVSEISISETVATDADSGTTDNTLSLPTSSSSSTISTLKKDGKSTSLFTSALSVLRKSNTTVPTTNTSTTISSVLLTPIHTNTGTASNNGLTKSSSLSLPTTLRKPSPVTLSSSSSLASPSLVPPSVPIVTLPPGKKVGFTLLPGKNLYHRVPNTNFSTIAKGTSSNDHDNDTDSTTLTSSTGRPNDSVTVNPFMLWLCNLYPSPDSLSLTDGTLTYSFVQPLYRIRYIPMAAIVSCLGPIHDRDLGALPSQYASIGKYTNFALTDTILHPSISRIGPTIGPYQSPLLTGNLSHLTKLSQQLESLIHIRQRLSPYPFVLREDNEHDRQREKEELAARYADESDYTGITNDSRTMDTANSNRGKGTNLLDEFNSTDIDTAPTNEGNVYTNDDPPTVGRKISSSRTIMGTGSTTKRKSAPKEDVKDKPPKSRKTGKVNDSDTPVNGTTDVTNDKVVPGTMMNTDTTTTAIPSNSSEPVENLSELAERVIRIGNNETVLRTAPSKQGGCELKHLKAYLRVVANAPVTGTKNQLVDRVLEYMRRNETK